jgi:hypothetical protein
MAGYDLDGEEGGKITYQVELCPFAQLVEKARDRGDDEWLKILYRPLAKGLIDHSSQLSVFGLIHHDHHVGPKGLLLQKHVDG